MAAHTTHAGTGPTNSRRTRTRRRLPRLAKAVRPTLVLVLVAALALIVLPRLAELVIFPTATPVTASPTAHALMPAARPGPRPDHGLGPTRPQPTAPAVPPSRPDAGTTGRITLHHGDTLWALAQRSHTSVATLQQLNGLRGTRIYAGHTLVIPTAIPPTVPAAVAGHGAAHRTHQPPPPRVQTNHDTNHSGTVSQLVANLFGPQGSCAAAIIAHESAGNVHATNPTSGAYGIPQALPANKMATFGSDWRDNPATQLAWMRAYVTERYGGACPAWTFWQAHHWY
jgi:LysM repeat protein